MALELLLSDEFDRARSKLSKREQDAVDLSLLAFWRDPSTPSLSYKRLEKGLWAFRVNLDLRVILHAEGNRRVLLHVNHHDKAYDWATRRRVERHRVTGSIQIVSLPEVLSDPPAWKQKAGAAGQSGPAQGPFSLESEEYLLALGVPPDWIGAVRVLADADALVDLVDKLEGDVWERLAELAEGRRPEPPPPLGPTDDPWATPEARRRFWVAADEAALAEALDRPWAEWAVYLHPAQDAAVQRSFTGPARVTGTAGTGKSVVALHRAARLARSRPEARVLLSTFSKALAQRLSQGMDLLLHSDPDVRARVVVRHLHAVALEVVADRPPRPQALGDRDLDAAVLAARVDLPEERWTDSFLVAEWRTVIDFWGVRDAASYRAMPRTGRGSRLSVADRDLLWPVFARMREGLTRQRQASWADICEAAGTALSARGEVPFDHVLLDEAQDFGPRELAFAMQLAPLGTDGLFLTGDAGQRIYRYPFAWSDIGLDVRGRSSRLRVNYRTSAEIRRAADRVLPTPREEIGGGASPRAALSRFRGPEPVVRACQSREEERQALHDWLVLLRGEGIAPGEIAVLARTNDRLADALDAPARALGLQRQMLADDARDRLYAGTLHGAKGLEFRAVAVVGAEAETLPLARLLAVEADPAARAPIEEQERNLLYVGMTRARQTLLVTHVGPASPFLSDQAGQVAE